ncbi:MAG: hypothetical protein L0Y56_11615 [Nitrospira sp.]|nr:hypothetical protein [Nitrospira sp.]
MKSAMVFVLGGGLGVWIGLAADDKIAIGMFTLVVLGGFIGGLRSITKRGETK